MHHLVLGRPRGLLFPFANVHNDIISAIYKGRGVCLILLDLPAAFGIVDHTILCDFLENHIGFSGYALCFFKSYLADWTQHASVKGVFSEMNRLVYGVPQGSVLGLTNLKLMTVKLSSFSSNHLEQNSPRIQISIGQSKINSSSTCKSLGVMPDANFSQDTHISNVCCSTHFQIWNVTC